MNPGDDIDPAMGAEFGAFIDSWHLASGDDVPVLVQEQAVRLGATAAVIYLVDYDQTVLQALTEDGATPTATLGIDSTMPGRAFRTVEILMSDDDGGHRTWLPLLDGTERVGVLEIETPARPDEATLTRLRHLAVLTAVLTLAKGQYGDRYHRTRRSERMSLAAELQWNLLPPLTFATEDVLISGHVQPSYDVGGDAFDYALNGSILHIAIIDAMGHGLEASLLSAIALGAYRNCRRHGDDLEQTYTAMDAVIAQQFGIERFVTALLAELDVATGRIRWINAGHPAPLVVRRRQVVGTLECRPTTPVGFGGGVTELASAQLEPADRVLLYTDGVVESRDEQGRFFGVDRLAELVGRESSSGQPAPETLRRLAFAILAHQSGPLVDDVTTVFVEWRGAHPSLLPDGPRTTP